MDYPPNPDGTPSDPHGPTNVGNDMNHYITLNQAYDYLPTPTSWLARKIYSWFRPKNNGNTGNFYEWSTIMGALAWYNRDMSPNFPKGNPQLAEANRPIVKARFQATAATVPPPPGHAYTQG